MAEPLRRHHLVAPANGPLLHQESGCFVLKIAVQEFREFLPQVPQKFRFRNSYSVICPDISTKCTFFFLLFTCDMSFHFDHIGDP